MRLGTFGLAEVRLQTRPSGDTCRSRRFRSSRVSGAHGRPSASTCCRIVFVVATADPVTFLIAVALAAAISTGVFLHATKHGSRHPTAWGVAAFLAAGVAVPVYFIRYWTRRRARDEPR